MQLVDEIGKSHRNIIPITHRARFELQSNSIHVNIPKIKLKSTCDCLYLFCLGARDVSASPRVQPRATGPLQSFQITLTVDGISQEFNETFSMELTGFDLTNFFLFPDEAPVTVNSLQGTIIDQDSEYYFCVDANGNVKLL